MAIEPTFKHEVLTCILLVTIQSELDALRDLVITDLSARLKLKDGKKVTEAYDERLIKSRDKLFAYLKSNHPHFKEIETFDVDELIRKVLSGD